MSGVIKDLYWCDDYVECCQGESGGGTMWRTVGNGYTTCRLGHLHSEHRVREKLPTHRHSSITDSCETSVTFRRSITTIVDVSSLTPDHDRKDRVQHHTTTTTHNSGNTQDTTTFPLGRDSNIYSCISGPSSLTASYVSPIAEEADIEHATLTQEEPRQPSDRLPLPIHPPKSTPAVTSCRPRGTCYTQSRGSKQTGAIWVPVLLTLLGAMPALARDPFASSVNSLGVYRVDRVGGGDGLFLLANNSKVTAQAGATAFLPCRLSTPIGDGMVSWVRRRHYQLLTIGRQVYSSDSRLGVKVSGDGREWVLMVRFVSKQDAGQYQCHVSSNPPTALTLNLHVVEAQAEIVGGPERYIHHGSSLLLVCHLKGATEPPVYVFWYRGDRMINYDAEDGVAVDNSRRSSKLYIASVSGRDEGNYTCLPSNAVPASVLVTVIQKENPVGLLQNSNTENEASSSTSSKPSPPKVKSGTPRRQVGPPWLSLLSLALHAFLTLRSQHCFR